MIGNMALVWFGVILFFSGMGLFIAAYLGFRLWIKTRIVCYIYNKNRQFYRKLLRPDSSKILRTKDQAYLYKEEMVLMTPVTALLGLFNQWLPTLVFEEDTAAPIDLFRIGLPKVTRDNISATEFSRILNDKSVTDFVNSQSGVKLSQVVQMIIIGIVVNVLVVGGAVYYIIKAINGGKVVG